MAEPEYGITKISAAALKDVPLPPPAPRPPERVTQPGWAEYVLQAPYWTLVKALLKLWVALWPVALLAYLLHLLFR